MTLVKRILVEKRAFVVPIVLGLLVNVAVYALVVYPLNAKAAGAAARASAAASARRSAEGDLAAARALVTSKTRADQELTAFYEKVLPGDLSTARRMTYASLPALARKANVNYEARRFEVDPSVKGPLGRLQIRMVLQGDYESIRQFVYELETAREFVIIDEVTLAQVDPNRPLSLTLGLSAYFRLGSDGD